MPKINMANIQSALGKVKDAAAPLQNKGHTENVPVDFIRLADRNIYNEDDSSETIKELADNIQACGLLHPITVNKIASDNYQIISGERRFRAVTECLHWKSVPCMVFDSLSPEAAQLKLCMANLAVREYSASQKYRFYLEVKALLEKMKASGEYKGGMQKGIATILNVTERQVRKYAQIEKLPQETQREVIDGKISLNKAIEQNTEKEESESIVLSKLLENLSSEQRNMLLSGKIDLSSIMSKAEPVPIFEDTGTSSETKKAEPVPIFEDTGTSPETKKAEPVPIFEDTGASPETRKAEPVPIFKDTSASPETRKAEPVPIFEDTGTSPETKKAEPVPIFEDTGTSPETKKAEPVPIFEDTGTSPETRKAEPVPIFEDTIHSPSEKGKPVPMNIDTNSKSIVDNTDSKTASDDSKSDMEKTKRLQDGSVLIYKNGQFIPNKIQILEEHEEYTVFKVFAVKL